jgi:tight adherence protein B
MSPVVLVLAAAVCAAGSLTLLVGGVPGVGRARAPGRRGPGLAGGWLRAGRRWRGGPEPSIGELLSGLAAELAAGQPPGSALEAAAQGCSVDPCPRARTAARTGGDVAAALRQDAREPGANALEALAACWEVAAHSGAGLAQAVRRLAEGLRATREARGQLDAEVAAARASAKLLAALPIFGVALGQWLGADPLGWLLASWIGRLVLAVGVVLELVGLWWLHRMVAAVRVGL